MRTIVTPQRVLSDVPHRRDLARMKPLAHGLRDAIEPVLSEAAHGWRRGRSVQTALDRIDHMRGRMASLDVCNYFGSIDQKRLGRMVRRLQDGVHLWEQVERWLPESGLPEGAPISPILANLYLNTIDRRFPLTRYGDNFVVCTHELDKTLRALCTQLHDVGLYTHFLFTDRVRFCGYEGERYVIRNHGFFTVWTPCRPGLPQRSVQVVPTRSRGCHD